MASRCMSTAIDALLDTDTHKRTYTHVLTHLGAGEDWLLVVCRQQSMLCLIQKHTNARTHMCSHTWGRVRIGFSLYVDSNRCSACDKGPFCIHSSTLTTRGTNFNLRVYVCLCVSSHNLKSYQQTRCVFVENGRK